MLGFNTLKSKVSELDDKNKELIEKTAQLNSENNKMNSIFSQLYGAEFFTGETNFEDLPPVNEIIISHDLIRLRAWQFLIKNHIANLMVTKRVDWLIGSGLLFNSKASVKPFIEFYGEKKGKEKHKEFNTNIEYLYRNLINTEKVDYTKKCNLHEMARKVDYNSNADGSIFMLMRIKDGIPNLQAISGQCLVNPLVYEIPTGHTINEGVEKNKADEVVAYHILINTNVSNTEVESIESSAEYGTKRISATFKNTNIKQAWLYSASDLQKLGETVSLPPIAYLFESIQHTNDYIIANTKNAQLKAQLVIALEKDANSDGTKEFNSGVNIAGVTTTTTDGSADELARINAVGAAKRQLKDTGIVLDLSKGVKANSVNDTSQSDQKEFLSSTLRTIFASFGIPYEVMLSSYDSNYSASQGARSDFQHYLDVTTEVIPSAQLYKRHYNVTLYLMVLDGRIECEPLKKAYRENDIITIQAISNSKFDGTKIKPIDPLKFIKALKEQVPLKYRDSISYDTIESIVNQVSGLDLESTENQVASELEQLPEILKPVEPIEPPIIPGAKKPVVTKPKTKAAIFDEFIEEYTNTMGDVPDNVMEIIDTINESE